MALYAVLIACGLDIAQANNDPFGRLIAVGIVAMFAAEMLITVGMSVGLMPITGLTLPFMSYGGSSLVVSMISVGLLNNIGRCRPFGVLANILIGVGIFDTASKFGKFGSTEQRSRQYKNYRSAGIQTSQE